MNFSIADYDARAGTSRPPIDGRSYSSNEQAARVAPEQRLGGPPSDGTAGQRDFEVALVHDYLNQRGGAERVVLELASTWPGAPLYTTLYRPNSTFPAFREMRIHTSPLDSLPVDGHFRLLAPLYPAAMYSLGPLTADAVVASTSGWAHGIRVAATSVLIAYCHTPARWLYRPGAHLRRAAPFFSRPLLTMLRSWDQRAAARPTVYVANSRNVQQRIRQIYNRDAAIVYPPVATDRFTPSPVRDRLLVVSRLIDYKRVDSVIRAANQAHLPLDIVGRGPSEDSLRELAGCTVTFHGTLEDAAVTQLMQSCSALVVPGEEDFGITAVEAHAAGKPVVAFGAGGALETIEEGFDGALFTSHDQESILSAIAKAESLDTSPEDIARQAARFNGERFRREIRDLVNDTVLPER